MAKLAERVIRTIKELRGDSYRMQYGIVIPSKYQDILDPLIESIYRHEKPAPPICVIADNCDMSLLADVHVIRSDQPFVYARNVNLGINFFQGMDVVLCNDDIRLVEPTFEILSTMAHKYLGVGLLAPLVDGGVATAWQSWAELEHLWAGSADIRRIDGVLPQAAPVAFVCVYIRRALIDMIGLLDEQFVFYGYDDNDFCIRTRKARMHTCITKACHVKHGDGGAALQRGKNWSLSFARAGLTTNNSGYFFEKHRGSQVNPLSRHS